MHREPCAGEYSTQLNGNTVMDESKEQLLTWCGCVELQVPDQSDGTPPVLYADLQSSSGSSLNHTVLNPESQHYQCDT